MTKLQKDHMMILLESIDSKMQITVETVCSLNDKIEGVEERLNCRIDQMDCILKVAIDEIATLHKKVDAVDKKVDAVDKKVDAVDKKVDAVDKKVDAVDRKVDAVDKKVDAVYQELVAHRNDTELHRRPTKRPSLKKVA